MIVTCKRDLPLVSFLGPHVCGPLLTGRYTRVLNLMVSHTRSRFEICHVSIHRIAAVLEGKGGGKKGRYQGKANTLKTRVAEEKLKEFTIPVNDS